MTVLATVLTFAALSCKPGVAPFFRLPFPAVTNGEIRTGAIPQRSNATNFVGRLDGHVMSALYGTTEALFERRLFPVLMNYGGARFAPAKKLATVDFGDGIVKNLYSTNWFAKHFIYPGSEDIVPSCFVHGESRDFSNRFTRVAWPIDLLDGFVYGTRGLTAYTNNVIGAASVSNIVTVDTAYMPISYSLDRRKNTQYQHVWLVPKAFAPEDSGPLGTWCLNNASATADWNGGHLLSLGELDLRDCCPSEIFGSRRNPWSEQPPARELLPNWAQDFMWQLSNGPEYGRKAIYFYDILGPNPTPRGIKSGITGRDLFWNYPTNDPPHIAKTNATSRFYGERFAFANTVLSLCERTVDYPDKVSWVEATNTTSYPVFQAPRFRYRQRRFSGGHRGSLKMTSSDGCKIVPDDSGVWAVWDLSKFKEGETKTTNWVSAVTSIVENVTAGWSEGTPIASAVSPVSLSGSEFNFYPSLVAANSSADFGNYKWDVITSFDGNVGDGHLWFSAYVYGTQTNGVEVAPFMSPYDGYSAFIGSVVFNALEDIHADLYLNYDASYKGVEPLFVRPLKGPTSLEAPDVTNETEWSIAPAPRAQFLWDNGIIESIDVNKFTTVGVSTNELLLTGIVEDGMAFNYSQSENIWERQNDTWMYFKYDEAFTGVKSHSMLLANYELFNLTFRNDIEDIAGMNPSGNNKLPTLEIAQIVPDERVKSALKDLFDSAGGVVSNHLDISIGSSCDYFGTPLVTQDESNKETWYVSVAPSSFRLGLDFYASTNPPPRKSAAYGYEAKPVIITNWNFPMMHDDGESSQSK